MIIDAIRNGIVIDHIPAGRAMEIYRILGLDDLSCSVAIIKNASSNKMGKKDIIKIDELIQLNLDVLGYIDPGITINLIQNDKLVKKYQLSLPERVTDVIRCRNPRCITTTEQELPHVFKLTDRENRVYRCLYCDSPAKRK